MVDWHTTQRWQEEQSGFFAVLRSSNVLTIRMKSVMSKQQCLFQLMNVTDAKFGTHEVNMVMMSVFPSSW